MNFTMFLELKAEEAGLAKDVGHTKYVSRDDLVDFVNRMSQAEFAQALSDFMENPQ